MTKLYIDCNMGAAGDMLMASLYELLGEADREEFIAKMNSLAIPGVKISAEKKMSNVGIAGTHMKVLVNGEEEGECSEEHEGGHEHHNDHEHSHDHHHHHEHDHHHHHEHHHHEHEHGHHHEEAHGHHHHHEHRGLKEITELIRSLDLPERVKEDAVKVFTIISEAESTVHGRPMEDIHFHEVGTFDAVADVVGNCLLIYMHGYPDVIASPIHVGTGTVKCAHGVLPVPAPATALILRGVPIYGGEIEGELCTPTGAAILKYFVGKYAGMPPMMIEKIGYGIGTKEFKCANCLRTILGTSHDIV